MEDPDLVIDLREHNHSTSDKFKLFWEQCKAYLQEVTAVHERRHDQVTYLAAAISVRDLIEQVKKRCPEGTPIPSEQWTRLQFWPKNPRTKVASYYQKVIEIKMMVQKRQFRKTHPDSHYAAAVFRYMREYAVRLRDHCLFISLDDKHRIKVGEPGFPVAAAERGKKVIVSLQKEFHVGDHDFTKFSLIPSVAFIIDIPTTIDGSWYDGEVYIGLKDAVFEPSSPLRHLTELYSILVKRIGIRKAIFIYTDGGADHRLTFVSVQLALIALFLNLNLDFICAGRTCPYHSWRNPVERIMSTINLGCQCVGLMREEGPAQFEAAIKNANNLGQLRKNAFHFKDEVKTTLNQPIELLSDILQRLMLKNKYFKTFESCDDNDIDAFWEILLQVDRSLTIEDTTKKAIKDKKDLQDFLTHCCQIRNYSFCIKKCGADGCKICQPVSMQLDVFSQLRFLPDPMINPSSPEHYLSFDAAMQTKTSEKDCPSLQRQKKKTISYSPSVQHVKNVNVMVQCEDCLSWRLLFSKKKLTNLQRRTLEAILDDVSYSCGASFEDIEFPDGLESVCIRDHNCGDPVERLYYSAEYDAICYYCASENISSEVPTDVYPLCSNCSNSKEHVKKRSK